MIISMLCWLSIGLSLIFNGYIENILIIIATILAYTYFSESKDYKNILIGLIISFAIINLSIIFFIKDSIKPKSIELGEVQKDTLVVLVYDGEDRNYNVRERANEMYYEQGYKSYFNSIYSLYKHKSYYEKLGSSDFKDTTYDIESRLRDKLGYDYKVISTYMYTKPYFENYIQESAALGYKDIIICPMFITEGKDFKNFKERLEKLELSKYGLNIRLTEVLYKSSNLAKAYADEIVNDINNKEIDAGVLLVGLHNENNLEQDIIFREKTKYYID
ncbi:MAG: CbiX/SirB N-terminal domain-containing protein, partial [Paraclostridium sp.]